MGMAWMMRSIEGSTTAISSISTPRSSVPICTIFGSLPVSGIVAAKVYSFSACWIRERLMPCLFSMMENAYTSLWGGAQCTGFRPPPLRRLLPELDVQLSDL